MRRYYHSVIIKCVHILPSTYATIPDSTRDVFDSFDINVIQHRATGLALGSHKGAVLDKQWESRRRSRQRAQREHGRTAFTEQHHIWSTCQSWGDPQKKKNFQEATPEKTQEVSHLLLDAAILGTTNRSTRQAWANILNSWPPKPV